MYPAVPSDSRASDADRQRVAEALGEALAAGRLTAEEHEERLQGAFAAKTVGELESITRDLPVIPSEATGHRRVSALFSKVRQGGPLLLAPEVALRSLFGAAYLNLENAEFTNGVVDIDARTLFGKAVVVVPANARVQDDGNALFGKRSLPSGGVSRPEGPLIRIHGRSLFGKLTVWRAGAGTADWWDARRQG